MATHPDLATFTGELASDLGVGDSILLRGLCEAVAGE